MNLGQDLLQPDNPYLLLARGGKNHWWRYLLALLVIAFMFMIPPALTLAGLGLWLEFDGDPATKVDLQASSPFVCPGWQFVSALGLGFVFLLLGLWLVLRFLHRRPFRTLITSPKAPIRWFRILEGWLVWFGLAGLMCLLQYLLYPQSFTLTFQPGLFLPLVLASFIFLPIQSATEELLVRGYLQQSLALLFPQPIWPILISSLVFLALHLGNPELMDNPLQENLLTAGLYLAGALTAAVLTIQERTLELALGMHIANNLFASIVVNYKDSVLPTEAIFTIQELHPIYDLVTLVLSCLLFYAYFTFWRRAESPISSTHA